ncbi:hypothetical protein HPB50_003186 [Hyalomma asiaticum]|uniref:Uncharacterized protein n=1 Tax=Hyalomma asiaticum TaxID=266040 RepID=A0ACB7T7S8_HYAAI|nr:hypothetical protein HPB50_003186 [Hyalomma asiaticum]
MQGKLNACEFPPLRPHGNHRLTQQTPMNTEKHCHLGSRAVNRRTTEDDLTHLVFLKEHLLAMMSGKEVLLPRAFGEERLPGAGSYPAGVGPGCLYRAKCTSQLCRLSRSSHLQFLAPVAPAVPLRYISPLRPAELRAWSVFGHVPFGLRAQVPRTDAR